MKYLKAYQSKIIESFNYIDFKNIFLKLTEFTIPYGHEYKLYPILYDIIPDLKKDSFGNLYIEVGESKTLFTSHLDTYSKKFEKVNHIIDGSIIKTDGKTILGGDNKNGVLILLYMIKMNVPGTYYFFIGEEGIVTGESCNGSTWVLHNKNFYIKFDRAIAFDRRGMGSIVTKQRARKCCSDVFANSLIDEYSKNGLNFKKEYAYGTDSAVFMDIIPEITNISSGGEYEHSNMETTNLKYLIKVAKASTNIKWENLPVFRDPKSVETQRNYGSYSDTIIKRSSNTFIKLKNILLLKGFNCINSVNFKPNTIMIFDQFVKDNYLEIKILDDKVKIIKDNNYFKGFKIGTITDLINHLNLGMKDFIKSIIGHIMKRMDENNEILINELLNILNIYSIEYKEFKHFIENSKDYSNYFIFYDDKIYMNGDANNQITINRQKEQKNKI